MFVSRFFKIVGIVTMLYILTNICGFAREITIGYMYGTSYQADSIITAFTLPNFIYIVIGGAITTAFISVYSKMEGKTKNDFAQTVLTLLCIVGTVLMVLFLIFPTFWMTLFFGGMTNEAITLTSQLFRVTAPATLFLMISMPLAGLHNVHENYRLSTFSTLMFNAIYVVFGVVFTPILMEYSYALGATLGALSMLWILLYQMKKQNLAPLGLKLVFMPEVKKLLYLALPLLVGEATLQFYFIIQRIFASSLAEGAIASVNYASKMTQFPQGVLMASVTTVIYPMLAKAAGQGDFYKIEQAYKQGFRLLAIILLPACAFMFVYAKEIIMILFEYGNFSVESTNATYPLLKIFAFSIFGLALNTYITRFFYALENTWLPNVMNIIAVFGINILIIMLFLEALGAAAIAWGTVISTMINMIFLIIFAKTKLKLVICSWSFAGKVALFIASMIIVFYMLLFLPIENVLLLLFVGGLTTVLFIGGGLKLVK